MPEIFTTPRSCDTAPIFSGLGVDYRYFVGTSILRLFFDEESHRTNVSHSNCFVTIFDGELKHPNESGGLKCGLFFMELRLYRWDGLDPSDNM
jgi:hypothetical protein